MSYHTLSDANRPANGSRDGRPVLWFVNTVLRERRMTVGLPLVACLLAVLVTSLTSRRYVAEASFIPQGTQSAAGRYAGLAAQFGLSLGGGGSGEGVDFYAELLESTGILRDAVLSKYAVDASDSMRPGVTLAALYGRSGRDQADSIQRAIKRLRRDLRVRTSLKSNFVDVAVTTTSPELAVALNERLLDLVTTFNHEKRTAQAGAERRFVAERLAAAEVELGAAEAALQRFHEQNRSFSTSPQLNLEAARLQRRVELAHQVFVSLKQAFEQARIEEVRNTPLISLVTAAPATLRPVARPFVRNTALALLLGLGCALGVVFMRAYVATQREENPGEFAAFVAMVPAPLARGLAIGSAVRQVSDGPPAGHPHN